MPLIWKCRDRLLERGEGKIPLLMGILNVTPDSFSDGGCFNDTGRAVDHGLRMIEEGADIIDIGGESTRPGASPVPEAGELRRVIPVVEKLAESGIVISVDTRKAAIAGKALACGAHIVNDVSALTSDPLMVETAGSANAGVVVMHMAGEPRTMQDNPHYEDAVREVREYLERRVADLVRDGMDRDTIAVDPGIGFGKTAQHNIELLGNIGDFRKCGRPVMVGLSRKRFLGLLTGRDTAGRLAASLGALSYACIHGIDIARVHDIKESRDAMLLATILMEEKRDSCIG